MQDKRYIITIIKFHAFVDFNKMNDGKLTADGTYNLWSPSLYFPSTGSKQLEINFPGQQLVYPKHAIHILKNGLLL